MTSDECEEHLRTRQAYRMSGRYMVRAYPKGLLEAAMLRGLTLAEAREDVALRLRCAPLRVESHNMIVTLGLGLVADFLVDVVDAGVTYHAFGTGSVAPVMGNTALGTEAGRKLWTTRSRSGAVVSFSVFYAAASCTFYIREVGAFGGAAASATPGSGTLFNRALLDYDNSGGANDLTFDLTVTLANG